MSKALSYGQFVAAKNLAHRGMSTKQIATKLSLGESTVRQIKSATSWGDYQKRYVIKKRLARKKTTQPTKDCCKEANKPTKSKKKANKLNVVVIELPDEAPSALSKFAFFVGGMLAAAILEIILISIWRLNGNI